MSGHLTTAHRAGRKCAAAYAYFARPLPNLLHPPSFSAVASAQHMPDNTVFPLCVEKKHFLARYGLRCSSYGVHAMDHIRLSQKNREGVHYKVVAKYGTTLRFLGPHWRARSPKASMGTLHSVEETSVRLRCPPSH